MALQHSVQLVFSLEHFPESRLSHWFLGKILSVWEPFLTFLVSVRYMVTTTVYNTLRTHRRHFHVTSSSCILGTSPLKLMALSLFRGNRLRIREAK